MMSFQLIGLPYEPFAPLFTLSDSELSELCAQRVIAASKPGFPCRVSLADAEIGEELLLLPFEHQPAKSPYKASGPIFVRRGAVRAAIDPGVIPGYVSTRLMSVRAYDASHFMIDATVCAGKDVAPTMDKIFGGEAVSYIHLHNANRGCFACAVQRV
jgi:hypothetical protein